MIQETLDRSGMSKTRCTATGWQTVAKLVEREVNSVPLGFLHHQGSANPMLRVLTPALLKNSTFSDRAPKGLFNIPDSPEKMMTIIEETYNLWFQIWNLEYIPLVMDRQKWHTQEENLVEQDLVYFKLSDSPIAADWKVGKVEYTNVGKDGLVRGVGISYSNKDDADDWRHSVVERPVRAVVKLMNVEDTSILDDMEKVRKLAEAMLNDKNKPVDKDDPSDEEVFLSSPYDKSKIVDVDESASDLELNVEEIEASDVDKLAVEKETTEKTDSEPKVESKRKRKKKRKSELEKLKIDNKAFNEPLGDKRKRKRPSVDAANKLIWTNLGLAKMIALNPKEESEEKLNISLTNMIVSSDSIAKFPMLKVTTNDKEFTWPVVISHPSQIGATTAALCNGVTEMIGKGVVMKNVWDTGKGVQETGKDFSCDNVDKYCTFLT